MCGIVGIFAKERQRENSISKMTRLLDHRGPDNEGYYVNDTGTVHFGHTRLSILDLTENANQPFVSNDGRYVLVYNGEVFNFLAVKERLVSEFGTTFRTTSDTEVIVEAFCRYREKVVDHLEGMFAFAIYDIDLHQIYLFRDRVGKKPLFYYKDDENIIFASEIKSIVAHPTVRRKRKVRNESIYDFLHLGYIPEPFTIYQNVYKFPAASIGTIDKSFQLKIDKYWSVNNRIFPFRSDVRDAKQGLHQILSEAVSQRLISDVPLGTFLSGGIDSSLVTALAVKETGKIKTFTIGFEENKFDETVFASKVAKHLKTEHYDFKLSQKEALQTLEQYVYHFDEPFYDTSAIPTMLVARLARDHVKVALTGDGADELFQGYGVYRWADRMNNPLFRLFKHPISLYFKKSPKSRYARIPTLLESPTFGQTQSHLYSQEQGLFSQAELKGLLEGNDSYVFNPNIEYPQSMELPSERQAFFDLNYYLKDDLLVKVDRASMYFGLECRSPFLDHKVVEYAFSLEHSLKFRHGASKWILREILKEYFPPRFFDRPKKGFSIPLAQWMKGELKFLLTEYLNERIVKSVGLVHFNKVNELVLKFNGGHDFLYTRIWVLIVVHKWMKEFLDEKA